MTTPISATDTGSGAEVSQVGIASSDMSGVYYVQDFEQTASGTTLTQANSGPTAAYPMETAWSSAVALTTGVTATYDNSRAARGSQSCLINSGTSSGTAKLNWSPPYKTAVQSFRFYAYFPDNPAASATILYVGIPAGTLCARFHINTSGTLSIDTPTGNNIVTTTNAVPLNQWVRIEGWVNGNSTAGQASLSLFTDINSSTPLETITTNSSQNTTGVPGLYQFGVTNAGVLSFSFSLDDIAVAQGAGPIGVSYGFPLESSTVGVHGSDTGSGVEGSGLTASIATGDTGAGIDTASVGPQGSDTGAGADTASVAPHGSDTGSGAESASVGVSAADSGGGAQSAVVSAMIVLSDTAVGADSATVSAALSVTDAGSSAESADLLAVAPASDSALSAESADLLAVAPASDSALSADSAVIEAGIAPEDSFSAGELATVLAGALASDECSSSESARVVAVIPAYDSGTGEESQNVIRPAGGLMVMFR